MSKTDNDWVHFLECHILGFRINDVIYWHFVSVSQAHPHFGLNKMWGEISTSCHTSWCITCNYSLSFWFHTRRNNPLLNLIFTWRLIQCRPIHWWVLSQSPVCSYIHEEIRSLCHSSNHKVNKSRRLGWASRGARMDEGRSAFEILTGKPTETRSSESLDDRDGRILKKWVLKRGIWLIWLRMRIIWGLVNMALNLQVSYNL